MKRTLIVMRHAKTNAQEQGQLDYDRSLTGRGHRNAVDMGIRMKEKNLVPDLIIASPAKRTRQTAEEVAGVLGYDKSKIKFVKDLYHCTPAVFEEVIYETDDDMRTIMIIAHNPGTSDFANQLSPEFDVDDLPTGAVVATHVEAKHWTDFSSAGKEVFFYTYPKKEL